ncbi:MAG: MgtC/SapB family protein [Geoalkalibacter sp.]|uniref:MgtC/SapB family protein n=1 Tax=Geoalkalibacter sp. TaxID=3041440 RepID=UPI003D09E8E3
MLSLQTFFDSYELAILVKIIVAGIAGGIIGLEREKHGRPAGLRTHLLVAIGAALMMIISESFFLRYGSLDASVSPVRLDPSRVAAQIVTGIGFLGAGVILKQGISVHGLTTAASLWLVAGLGMAFGSGMFVAGGIATTVALFGLVFLKRLEPYIVKAHYLCLTITANRSPDIYPELERIFSEMNLRIYNVGSTFDLENQTTIYRFTLTQHTKRIGRELTSVISDLPGIKKISFE